MITANREMSSTSRVHVCGSCHSRSRKKQAAATRMLPSDEEAFATPTIISFHRRGMISEM